ncbi:MAG: hypothetical protein QUS13_16045, partial [Smithella sp.]|nr:hypothetical protein [Smithella sp.]
MSREKPNHTSKSFCGRINISKLSKILNDLDSFEEIGCVIQGFFMCDKECGYMLCSQLDPEILAEKITPTPRYRYYLDHLTTISYLHPDFNEKILSNLSKEILADFQRVKKETEEYYESMEEFEKTMKTVSYT